ncbi:hypothetical protein HG536_0B06230 [Torulaspora globosa]|uniref:Uncharacterized protein n=1 Tax=Torulaspora globosa TaxID=48254 RepID=A0A7G3ZE21_9SACH|nr:uncharacterized protein HG536_0B06230 [Torulaspora globosa]QLL31757.1 hypothetical protein HG536_0B06230 [Torulaspora globosa]
MSVYEVKYNTSASDPWAPFNEAIKRRQENPESFNEQVPWPWIDESENENVQTMFEQQGSLADENQGNQTAQEEFCEQENASDSEDCENRESESGSSRYDDSDTDESEYEEYDGPDDYITDVFDITNFNPAVEDAIVYYNKTGANRRTVEYKKELAAIINKQREDYYSPPSNDDTPSSDDSDSSQKLPVFPLPPYNPLFDDIRQKRSERRLQFGTTRVIRFKGSDIVAKDGSKVPKDKLPGKSILKNEKDQFVTPNHDFELVGESELSAAIGRLYNLCDMPLEVLDKNEPVHSTENLAAGFANALKYQQLCWKRMSEEAVRVRDEALKRRKTEMEALKLEKDALNVEVAELRQKLREKEINLEDVVRKSRIDLSLAEEKKQDLKQAIVQMEVIKLDLLEVRSMADELQVENDALRKELKSCQNNLQEQKEVSKPLLIKIKELEARVLKEQKYTVESQQKLAFLERYRRESFVLQKKIEDLEESNRKLISESGKLQEVNDDVLRQSNLLKNSLGLTVEDLKASKKREAELAMANKDLVKQLDESNANVRRLVDTNTAYKAKFHLKYQEFEKKYAQVWTECNNRRKEIEKTKLEMEKMGGTLRETRKEMARKRGDNTVSICSENMVVHEPPIDVSTAQSSHVKGGHRIFQSLTNRFYSSPVINAGEV